MEAEVSERWFAEELTESFRAYAATVVRSRAVPDVRDGLKPVQRRILWGMWHRGLRPGSAPQKSAKIVGEVMGTYHPHGDLAIYESLCRLAQPHAIRVPLVEGHGNFGGPGHGPAAARYTECRPAEVSRFLLADLDRPVVRMLPNYDGTAQEPEVLPVRFPQLLVNGAQGIAVGLTTGILPHHPGSVCRAALALLEDPGMSDQDVVDVLGPPDLPGGGVWYDPEGAWRRVALEGHGTLTLRGEVRVAERGTDRTLLTISSLPPPGDPATVLERLQKAGDRIPGLRGLRDLSDREHPLLLAVDVRPDVPVRDVMAAMFRHGGLESQVTVSQVVVTEEKRVVRLGAPELLRRFLTFRFGVVERQAAHRVQELQAMVDRLRDEEVVFREFPKIAQRLHRAGNLQDARKVLQREVGLTDSQFRLLGELRVGTFHRAHGKEVAARRRRLEWELREERTVLQSERRLKERIAGELRELLDWFGEDRRRTTVDTGTLETESAVGFTIHRDGLVTPDPDGDGWTVRSEAILHTNRDTWKRLSVSGGVRRLPVEVRWASEVDRDQWIVVLRPGNTWFRFDPQEVPVQGWSAGGVKAGPVLAVGVGRPGDLVLLTGEQGTLVTRLEDVPRRSRTGKGVLVPARLRKSEALALRVGPAGKFRVGRKPVTEPGWYTGTVRG